MQGMKTVLFLAEIAQLDGKIGAAFGAFGWSGEAPGRIYGTMENIFKMKMVKEPLMLKSSSLGGGIRTSTFPYGEIVSLSHSIVAGNSAGGANNDLPRAGFNFHFSLSGDTTGMTAEQVAEIDAGTGKVIWKKTGLPMFGRNAYVVNALAGSGAVSVASGNKLVGLAPATGQVLWETEILKQPPAGTQVYSQQCHLAAGEGVVAAAPFSQD